MRFSLEWLASYLPGPAPEAEVVRRRLTDAGFIGEGIEGSGLDAVVDLEVTPNRPDAMNHRGMALEASVALGRDFVDLESALPVAEDGPPVDTLATVSIEDGALCSRYSARVIEGIVVGDSSGIVAKRLSSIGSGVISAPVDATNHVLWDVGQPLHAFDLDKLAKGADGRAAIVVRLARAGERVTTLDGVDRALTPEMLVIADASGPIALAGVMGGLSTAISASTTRVLLESAHFSSTSVRRTARALGMHTDASHRFERGTDPSGTASALDRAARLILASSGGRVARGAIDVVARPTAPRTLTLRYPRLIAFLGLDVPLERVVAILSALGIRVKDLRDGVLETAIPAARVDLTSEVDLFEEVIRHVGYAALPETLPPPFVPTHVDPALAREERVRDILSGAGFFETVTYSFVSAEENAPFASLAPGEPAVLENPLGEPFEVLRSTPVIGLLRSASHNVHRGTRDLSLFEVGRAYGKRGTAVAEERRVGFLLAGERLAHFSETRRTVDFFDGSGVVSTVFRGLGAAAPRFQPAALPFLAPGRAATVHAGDGEAIGWVGVLSAALGKTWDLDEPVVGGLDIGKIPVPPPATSVEAPPRFPGSDFDLTVTHPVAMPFRELVAAARRDAPPELVSLDAHARYQGPNVAAGHVKTTLRFRFGSAERSLSREELALWRDQASARLLSIGGTSVDGY